MKLFTTTAAVRCLFAGAVTLSLPLAGAGDALALSAAIGAGNANGDAATGEAGASVAANGTDAVTKGDVGGTATGNAGRTVTGSDNVVSSGVTVG